MTLVLFFMDKYVMAIVNGIIVSRVDTPWIMVAIIMQQYQNNNNMEHTL